jgi:hypothetical protein
VAEDGERFPGLNSCSRLNVILVWMPDNPAVVLENEWASGIELLPKAVSGGRCAKDRGYAVKGRRMLLSARWR